MENCGSGSSGPSPFLHASSGVTRLAIGDGPWGPGFAPRKVGRFGRGVGLRSPVPSRPGHGRSLVGGVVPGPLAGEICGKSAWRSGGLRSDPAGIGIRPGVFGPGARVGNLGWKPRLPVKNPACAGWRPTVRWSARGHAPPAHTSRAHLAGTWAISSWAAGSTCAVVAPRRGCCRVDPRGLGPVPRGMRRSAGWVMARDRPRRRLVPAGGGSRARKPLSPAPAQAGAGAGACTQSRCHQMIWFTGLKPGTHSFSFTISDRGTTNS